MGWRLKPRRPTKRAARAPKFASPSTWSTKATSGTPSGFLWYRKPPARVGARPLRTRTACPLRKSTSTLKPPQRCTSWSALTARRNWRTPDSPCVFATRMTPIHRTVMATAFPTTSARVSSSLFCPTATSPWTSASKTPILPPRLRWCCRPTASKPLVCGFATQVTETTTLCLRWAASKALQPGPWWRTTSR